VADPETGTPGLRLLYRAEVAIAAPLEVGAVAAGTRRVIPITGGRFRGPRLAGRVLPGGADWQLLRRDQVTEVEARYTLETDDGALIGVHNWGLRHGPPEVLARLARGEPVDPESYYFRTTPRFECGHPDYLWLNGLVAVARAERHADGVVLDVYEVS
jgi:hypothetical protein